MPQLSIKVKAPLRFIFSLVQLIAKRKRLKKHWRYFFITLTMENTDNSYKPIVMYARETDKTTCYAP